MPITPLPTPPSRSDDEATFVSRANAFIGALPTFVTETNAEAAAVDADRVAAAASASAASGSASAAAASAVTADTEADRAEAAATIASAASNYRGEYAAGTTYQIGQSVSYLGSFFYAKTINTGVTPVQGANWELIGLMPTYTEFLAGGTYTKPAKANWIFVEAIGGGGAGGRIATALTNYGGGGGGEFIYKLFRFSDVGTTETVSIGAGGAGRVTDGAGADGGNTTFGSLLTARGGRGGLSGQGGDGGDGTRGGISAALPQQGNGGFGCGGGGFGSSAAGGAASKGGGGGGGVGTTGSSGAGGV